VLRPLVTKLIVCDPRENALIGRSAKKRDEWDVRSLCRLMRLGELKEVWHSHDARRRELLLASEQYLELRNEVVRRKNVLKAWYRRGGVMVSDTATVFSERGRQAWLNQLPVGMWRSGALGQYTVLDAVEAAWTQSWQRMKELGREFSEVAKFMAMPGIGEVGAHLFCALIGDPHRFATRQKLWRYCKLGIIDRSSDGKPLGYERLERRGNGALKGMSYHAWKGAVIAKGENEVKRFYEQSTERTGDKRHARLNTQRKILDTLWTLWRTGTDYDAQRFGHAAPAPLSPNAEAKPHAVKQISTQAAA
jgi:transposase